jgi:hypothetical protein
MSDEKIENCAKITETGKVYDFEAEKRAREAKSGHSTQDYAWHLEPHVCRACFGRMASRALSETTSEFMCTNCMLLTVSESHTDACCCGMKIRKRNGSGRSGGPMVDAGVRCIVNPEKSPAFPSAYVASEVVKNKRS